MNQNPLQTESRSGDRHSYTESLSGTSATPSVKTNGSAPIAQAASSSTSTNSSLQHSTAISSSLPTQPANSSPNNHDDYYLLEAAEYGEISDMEALLKKGANINVTDSNGNNILLCSIISGCFDAMKWLVLEKKVPLNGQDKDGYTALLLAASFGQLEMVECLVTHGADLYLTNNEGQTALDVARVKKRTAVIQFLEPLYQQSPSTTPILSAKPTPPPSLISPTSIPKPQSPTIIGARPTAPLPPVPSVLSANKAMPSSAPITTPVATPTVPMIQVLAASTTLPPSPMSVDSSAIESPVGDKKTNRRFAVARGTPLTAQLQDMQEPDHMNGMSDKNDVNGTNGVSNINGDRPLKKPMPQHPVNNHLAPLVPPSRGKAAVANRRASVLIEMSREQPDPPSLVVQASNALEPIKLNGSSAVPAPLPVAPKIQEELELGEILGSGGFGTVYKSIYHGNAVAIKILNSPCVDKETLQAFYHEVTIAMKLNSPNIVKVHGSGRIDSKLAIFMEYVAGGPLSKLLLNRDIQLEWASLFKLGMGVALGLEYLHKLRIVHCDIKTDNILVDRDLNPKICDLGTTKLITANTEHPDRRTVTIAGEHFSCTPKWTAPDTFIQGRKGRGNTLESDIYSFGLVLWQMWSRKKPYENLTSINAINESFAKFETEVIPDTVPDVIAALIRQCWAKDPAQRPVATAAVKTFEEVNKSLSVPTITTELSLGTLLGEGANGSVYKSSYQGKDVALKVLKNASPDADALREFHHEVSLMAILDSVNFVKLLGTCKIQTRLAMVMEFLPQGTLGKLILNTHEKLAWAVIASLGKGIANGVAYLHDRRLTHNDLKPDNILLAKSENGELIPKIADLGESKLKLACARGSTTLAGPAWSGSPLWMAPEIKGDAHTNAASDVYSMGYVIWGLFARKQPYEGMSRKAFFAAKEKGETDKMPDKVPKPIAKYIRACWNIDHKKRPTAAEAIPAFDEVKDAAKLTW